MGLFIEAALGWILFTGFTIYLFFVQNDDTHLATYKRFIIFGMKTIVIADFAMIFGFVWEYLGYELPGPGNDLIGAGGYIYGGIVSAIVLVLGSSMYPDWMQYWTYR